MSRNAATVNNLGGITYAHRSLSLPPSPSSCRLCHLRLLSRQGLVVPLHGRLRELAARHQRVLLQRALDLAVRVGLVEVGHAVPLAEVVLGRVRRRLDAVERRLEAVVAPGHEEVAAGGCVRERESA